MKIKLISLLLLAVLLVGCSAPSEPDDSTSTILHITAQNFETEVMASEKTVLLDFYADWCGPCQRMAPIVEEVAQERIDIKVGKVNVDEESALANQFGIESIPTLVVIQNGKVVQTAVGYRGKAAILSML